MTEMKEDRDESMLELCPLVDEVGEVTTMVGDKPINEDNPVNDVNEFPLGNGNNQPQTETDCNINVETKSGAEKSSPTSVPPENEITTPQTETKESIDNTELKSGAKATLKASFSSEEAENPPRTETRDAGSNLVSKSNTKDVQTVSSYSSTLNGYDGTEKKHDVKHPVDGEIKSYKIPNDESVPKHKNGRLTSGKTESKGPSDANSSLKPETESPTVGKLERRESSDVNSLNPDIRCPTDGTLEVSDSIADRSTVKADKSTGHENDGLRDSKPELLDVDSNRLDSSEPIENSNAKPCEASESKLGIDIAATSTEHGNINKSSMGSKTETLEIEEEQNKCGRDFDPILKEPAEPLIPHVGSSNDKPALENTNDLKNDKDNSELHLQKNNGSANDLFLLEDNYDGSESGTEEEQSAFMKELECFFRERKMDFKPPKFYGEGLNCLKLWRSVMRLGGYDKVTSCKLWRQVGESFKPPKTCTTVSWTFRGFYEKALLDFERSKTSDGELIVSTASNSEPMNMINDNQTPGSGRARRDAAARAMQGWHSQRVLGNGEVSDPIIKDKSSQSWKNRDKQVKSLDGLGSLKRKKAYMEHSDKTARAKTSKQLDVEITDIGPPAEWVKVNVERLRDCFEIYALVPGLLREEVRVQLDPAGRVVISGEPQQPDNPWGVTPFRKVVTLPSRIDPQDTTAVVTLHGQLFIKTPIEQPSV